MKINILLASILAVPVSVAQAATYALDVPSAGSTESGIDVIRGWACDASQVSIAFDGGSQKNMVYGNNRGDTETDCGDTDNGFEMLYNWNLLGEGNHSADLYVDGVLMSTVDFNVATMGTGETYERGLEGKYELEDFPVAGDSVTVEWSQAKQNFTITGSGISESYNGLWAGVNLMAQPPTLERLVVACVEEENTCQIRLYRPAGGPCQGGDRDDAAVVGGADYDNGVLILSQAMYVCTDATVMPAPYMEFKPMVPREAVGDILIGMEGEGEAQTTFGYFHLKTSAKEMGPLFPCAVGLWDRCPMTEAVKAGLSP